MCHKISEAMCNINNAFDPGTANKCTVQWQFKKFCKGDKSLEDECSGQLSAVDKGQLRAIIEANPLTTTGEIAKELCQLFCGHLAFEANWEGEKLNKWVLHELTENQNNNNNK